MSEPSRPLDLHRAFGRKHVAAAVEMAFERHALLGDLRQVGQAHHLIAAAVGQDRPLPAHEGVQAAEPRDPLGAGAEHEVIGVAEDDVGAGRAHVGRLHRLHRRRGADRHEGRRADLAAPHRDRAGAGAAVRGGDGEGEARHCSAALSKATASRLRGVGIPCLSASRTMTPLRASYSLRRPASRSARSELIESGGEA